MSNPFFAYNSVSSSSGYSFKALIVDDEDDMFYLLRNILRQRNIETIAAGGVADAFDALRQNPDIFLIFLDNHLPDGLGYQHIEAFKAISPATIVMLTAYDTSYDRKMAKDGGADDFLGKPFSREAILNIVDRFSSPPHTV